MVEGHNRVVTELKSSSTRLKNSAELFFICSKLGLKNNQTTRTQIGKAQIN